ncbi:MAG: hypothetical protein ACXVRN_12155 [Solirubrobacteraceae bacterium]
MSTGMDDEELLRLRRVWWDAERAYHDEVNKHVSWTVGEAESTGGHEHLTREDMATLDRLRKAAEAAQTDYDIALRS